MRIECFSHPGTMRRREKREIMDAEFVPCQKCLEMRCACEGKYPGFPTYIGQWAEGPSNQGPWCQCCAQQFIDLIKVDRDVTMRTLMARFLVTLAMNPDQYVREEPADPTGWSGTFPCWHPTNCQTMAKHTEKLKKSRSKSFSRVSKSLTGFSYAYWPYSYDQMAFPSPFPYIMTKKMAEIVLGPGGFDPAVVPPNPSVVLRGGNRTLSPLKSTHG